MKKIYYINRLLPNNQFRNNDEDIIQNIISAIHYHQDLSIRNIAKLNYTSPSSISRLSKRAGFNNFNELIFYLKNKLISDNYNQKMETLPYVKTNQDWNIIDPTLKATFDKRKIYLFGEGFCQLIVNYLYRKLLLKKIYAVDLDGVEISYISDQTSHTLITFSQSGENRRGLIKMEECKKYGGKVIAITNTENSSYTKNSDLFFIVDSGSKQTNSENADINFFFGNVLNLMEFLIDRYN